MGLKPFNPDAGLYEDILSHNQIGHGALGRYRGSELQNGAGLGSFFRSIFSRVARFATPLVRSAMPHVKSALESAKPHLGAAAQSVVNEAGKGIAEKISQVLSSASTAQQSTGDPQQQTGTGRKRRRAVGVSVSRKKRGSRLSRIPPFDLPDSF